MPPWPRIIRCSTCTIPGRRRSRICSWLFKAGFDAARLLEQSQSWKSAINIYTRLAALPGPQAEEAKRRAERLRMERFIWED